MNLMNELPRMAPGKVLTGAEPNKVLGATLAGGLWANGPFK
jgi:hypothetical protein